MVRRKSRGNITKSFVSVCLAFAFVLTQNSMVQAQDWRKIDDRKSFEKIYVNKTLRGISWPTANRDFQRLDTDWQIENCSDGTGVLTFWDHKSPRAWKITANDEVCIYTQHAEKCYFCEENMKYIDIYRCGVVGQKEAPWVFKVLNDKPEPCP